MTARAALITGTAVSLTVTAAWSWTAALTIGPAPAQHLTRNLPGDYTQLASGATGNGLTLFATVAVISTLCLLASGWRQQRRRMQDGT